MITKPISHEFLEREGEALRKFLRNERKLSPTECFVVLKLVIDCFPTEYIELEGKR